MEYKIKIKHQTGSKNGQIEEFAATGGNLTIGRSNNSSIQYDPDLDERVSREHAVISVDEKEADTFRLKDLNSTNGLFVNGKKVTGEVKIYAGDTVQVGKEGPKFIFDLDPRPNSHIKKTQVFDILPPPPKPTKEYEHAAPPPPPPPPPPPLDRKEGVSKDSAERMIIEERRKSRATTWFIAAGILILVIAGGVYLYRMLDQRIVEPVASEVKTPTQIAEDNSNKVVFIEVAWKLVLTRTGDDVLHLFIKKKNGEKRGVFQITEGKIEPVLTTVKDDDNKPIWGGGTGTGFVVAQDGFILTCRHVAAGWKSQYDFAEGTFPGVLVDDSGNIIREVEAKELAEWVPQDAMNFNNKAASKVFEGTNIYMDVTFARNDLRTPATLKRISNKQDVAMIKIDLPQVLPAVTLSDNYNEIQTGNDVTVLGYPGISPDQYSQIKSFDSFNSNQQIVKVPVPTLSQGNIGRLVKASTQTTSGNYFSNSDSYQLTINSTGPGNSGGPLFDNQGRVVGIFNAGIANVMTFAVPIKYGIELMGTDPVIDSK